MKITNAPVSYEQPHALWNMARKPLTKVVLAAFTDNIGNEPPQMSHEDVGRYLPEVFPDVDRDSAQQLGNWAVRNMVAGRLHEIDRKELDHSLDYIILNGQYGPDAGKAMVNHIVGVMGTRDRFEAVPILKLLSQTATRIRIVERRAKS
jgi:hypothetical protein